MDELKEKRYSKQGHKAWAKSLNWLPQQGEHIYEQSSWKMGFLSKNSVLVGLYVPNAEDEQIGK